MRRRIATFATATLFALTLAGGAAADHNAGPCNDENEPGNSQYAKHHIVPLATSGGLGEGGHKPGSHGGFSACQ